MRARARATLITLPRGCFPLRIITIVQNYIDPELRDSKVCIGSSVCHSATLVMDVPHLKTRTGLKAQCHLCRPP